ncbi:MAG: hypothetical protein QME90_03675 [Thermodesulfobacteriota bacterium]|nr:hypothetical protein [Thermodesulfobacteriota bacterium]
MNSDIFGNLMEWDKVLEVLDSLKESTKLDEHQTGLARILRYGQNWRLLERVLEDAKEISQPSNEFLLEVSRIMTDRNIYLNARMLALETLECLVPRIPQDRKHDHNLNPTLIVRKMVDMLKSPEPPIFHEAVTKSLNSIKAKREIEIVREGKTYGGESTPR